MSRRFDGLERNSVRKSTETACNFEVLENSGFVCNFSPIWTVHTHRVFWVVFRDEPQSCAWCNVTIIEFWNFFCFSYAKACIVFIHISWSFMNSQSVISMSNQVSQQADRLERHKAVVKQAHDWFKAGLAFVFLSGFLFRQLQPGVLGLFQEMSRWVDRLERNGACVSAEATCQLKVLKYSRFLYYFRPLAIINAYRVIREVFRNKLQSFALCDKFIIKLRSFFSSTYAKAGFIPEQFAWAPFNFQPVASMSDEKSWSVDWLKRHTIVVKLVHNWVEASVSLAFIICYFVQQKPVVLGPPKITSWRPHWLQRNRVCVSAKAPPHLEMLEYSGALCDLSPVETVDAHCKFRIVFRHEPKCLV